MKKFFRNWVIWKHIVFCFSIWLLIKIVATSINQASIGVIGSADGPTSILIAGNIYPHIISCILLIVVLALYIPLKKVFGRN
ncbi:MAG TPA: hypothetical protein GXX73_03445 [Clostridium sp.]|nr:hypothetical protein A7W90_03425 [Clostridium sp. Bc-iso-3]HHV28652.1 hypothetical protein [Clostridium sp.]